MTSPDQPARFLKLEEATRRVRLGKSMIYRLVREG
jgi:predicted DNA-binding transcriptional regulator AlpA